MRRIGLLTLLAAGVLAAAPKNLEIYWIDAEGGASTLIVAPSGESLLVDSGNRTPDDRDAKRIYAAAQQAGLKQIGILLTTHFHSDHFGGMPALAKLIPIGMYMDHGESVEIARPDVAAAYHAYEELSAGKRRILKAGDKIPLKGVDVDVIASAGQAITKALPGGGAPNPACGKFPSNSPEADPDPDNGQSVGIVLRYGKFRFIDMGDLNWEYELKLVCPNNLIGKIDLFQVSHHGVARSNSPQFVQAIQPKVMIMNNGSRKGGAASVFDVLRHSPGLEDIWQVHLALGAPRDQNSADDLIANFENSRDCKGAGITASVDSSGNYTITNQRNGFKKTYQAR